MKKILLLLAAGVCYGEEEGASTTCCEGIYLGAGLNFSHMQSATRLSDHIKYIANNQNRPLNESSSRQFGGTIVAGYGVLVCNNCYCGIEGTIDFSSGKNRSDSYKDTRLAEFAADLGEMYRGDIPPNQIRETKITSTKVIPTVAVHFGWHIPNINMLFYTKFGVSRIKTETELSTYEEGVNNITKESYKNINFTPTIGFGCGAAFGKWQIRADFDYRFITKKDKTSAGENDWTKIDDRTHGYVFRIECIRMLASF